MNSINHILVIMNPSSDQQPALIQALKVAQQTSASIELCAIVYNNSFISHFNFNKSQLAELQQEYVNTKMRWLETYRQQVEAMGIAVTLDVTWHPNLSGAVAEKLTNKEVSLVVKSTKQYSSIKKVFFTPSDWQLLEHCTVPLLLTKSLDDTPYKNLMAAVDPDNTHDKPRDLDNHLISAATELADLFKADTHISHCYQPIGVELWQGLSAVGMESSVANDAFNDYSEGIKQHHKTLFKTLLADYQFEDAFIHLTAGNAEAKLPELVKQHEIDLLVMGMSNNGQIIGNLIERVIDNVPCDILSLRAQ